MTLTEEQHTALKNCVEVAAKRFRSNARVLTDSPEGSTESLLCETFRRQEVEAWNLFALLSDATAIEVIT